MRDHYSGYGGGYGGRYRGGRSGGGAKVLAALAVVVLVVAGGWLGKSIFFPAPEPTPTPVPTPEATPTPEPTPTPIPMRDKPEAVRGLYVSGPMAGNAYFDNIIQLIDDTELNAVVIDVKGDEGEVSFRAEGTMAQEIGACVRYISDLPKLVEKLHAHGIYAIARIVTFKDPTLGEARPELMLKRPDGTGISESGKLYWVNPYKQEVWDYDLELALAAADAGFDEVQFDYVRFPSGKGTGDLLLDEEDQDKTRSEAVAGFLTYAVEELHQRGVWVSADVYGVVITNKGDGQYLGQEYDVLGSIVDAISPMVYPSHYTSGYFNLTVPDAEPYACVLGAMNKSREVLSAVAEEERTTVRPWLQAFTAGWVTGHINYGGEEIRAQIQAVYDAGYTEWLLWNAQNKYTADGLLPAEAQ